MKDFVSLLMNGNWYMTVELHFQDPENWLNLGMICVSSSQKAESLLKLVDDHLKEFDVTLKTDIVAMIGGLNCQTD